MGAWVGPDNPAPRHKSEATSSMKRNSELYCKKTSWRGRESYTLGNGLVQLVTLTGGGHIAEFRFGESTGKPSLNPLWKPPWKTMEPYRYRPQRHASRYGPVNEGKLLSGIAGHNICLDYFGPPSEEEASQGLSFHGEAPISRWQKTGRRVFRNEVALELSVRLPVAGLQFRREIKLRRGESVAYYTETVRNERRCDHFFHWTQHVTLAPPFLAPGNSVVVLPGTSGMTHPHGYDEGKALLAPKRGFRWPHAPARTGGTVDLSLPFTHRGLGFVVGVLLDTERESGFVAAFNTRERLLIGYCFRRRDYPWVAIWEENQTTAGRPWRRRTRARGLEFGTTPLPVVRREAFATGSLLETPTFACVPARAQKEIRYVAFLSYLPPGFDAVRDIRPGEKEIVIFGPQRKDVVRLPASGLSNLY
jgi:hypothetical protein